MNAANIWCRAVLPVGVNSAGRRPSIATVLGALIFSAVSLGPAGAEPAVQFDLPVACTVNTDCWIVHYVDRDPGPGANDYQNGFRTYDGHDGTDFAVRDIAAMEAGVSVLAAADGVVRALRDGMDDTNIRISGREAVRGRECGNGVIIEHTPGWATQYCHLRKNSVAVRKGQAVERGEEIGLVGNSGLAEFPHVHFNVFRDGEKIDPFAGESGNLWSGAARRQVTYEPVSIFAAGFREAVPDRQRVSLGSIQSQTISPDSPAIVFWTGIFGVRDGDTIKQTLHGPGGRLLAEREIVQTKNQIRRFLWIGKKRSAGSWPPGDYVGRTTVIGADGLRSGHTATARVVASGRTEP